jgi:Cu(I)/Ag(I) efflux system membrane fusion protein
MKKYIIYLVILISGLALGYVFFGTGDGKNEKEEAEVAGGHDHEGETSQMWTCSMHPQIMLTEAGDCPICGMDLIPADANADGLEASEFKMTKNAMALANIQTISVSNNTGSGQSLMLSGKIKVNDDLNATMPAHFDGRIEKLYINTVGDKVAKGDLIAKVYSPALVVAQQELITAAKSKDTQPQFYNAIRNKFENWKIHGELLDEVETSGNVRTSWPIYSHVMGTVTEIMVEDGAHIMDGSPILRVANLNSVWAVFDAYENQISRLKEGQEIKVTTNAFPDKEFLATISFIDPVLNTSRRTLTVRAVLDNKNNQLKPGMFIKAKLEVNNESLRKSAINIPRSAVLWTGERSLVYVKTNPDKPVFERREIQLGAALGDTYRVLSGLNGDEEIVANGTFTVDAAAQLAGKPSMMNTSEEENIQDNSKVEISEEQKKQLQNVFNNYMNLKDYLVKDKFEEAKAEVANLDSSLKSLDLDKFNASVQEALQLYLKGLQKQLSLLRTAKDISDLRANFDELSVILIRMAKSFKPFNDKVYVHHCPMAENDNGANWLSFSEKVRNPYYGSQMLNCGEITGVIENN